MKKGKQNMLYTINFTLFGDDNTQNVLTRRVVTDSMAKAEAAVYGTYGNSLIINTISIKEVV